MKTIKLDSQKRVDFEHLLPGAFYERCGALWLKVNETTAYNLTEGKRHGWYRSYGPGPDDDCGLVEIDTITYREQEAAQ